MSATARKHPLAKLGPAVGHNDASGHFGLGLPFAARQRMMRLREPRRQCESPHVPVDPVPAAPVAAQLPHLRKLSFVAGAAVMLVVILLLKQMME